MPTQPPHRARPHRRVTRRTLLRAAGAATGAALVRHLLPDDVAEAMLSPAGFQGGSNARQAADKPQVAIAQAESYDRDLIREQVFAMIEQLGGLEDVVKPGDKVAIKPNLTGGTLWERGLDVHPTESFVTHPAVTRALAEAALDAGAGEVFIVEAVYDMGSWVRWGNSDLARDLGLTLVDLNYENPYDEFYEQAVPNWLIYERFIMNQVLREADVFMSVAKLKCHATAGITLSMKNLVGLIPARFYQLDPGHSNRSELHGTGRQGTLRIPSVVMDLVRARPIDFALIDGVLTAEGSEGPWNEDFSPKAAHVLIAGKDMVATDTVGAAVMGFDPAAASFAEPPFRFCLNHLQLAASLGLGSNRLADVEIVGADLDDVIVPFRPYAADLAAGESPRVTGPYGSLI